jgi:hypothetical protein
VSWAASWASSTASAPSPPEGLLEYVFESMAEAINPTGEHKHLHETVDNIL